MTIGDVIAQLILEQIEAPPMEEVNDSDETKRGNSGVARTGIESNQTNGKTGQISGNAEDQNPPQGQCASVQDQAPRVAEF